MLQLQRTAGNAAVGRLVRRRAPLTLLRSDSPSPGP
jgi:hypothetical protein